MAKRLTPLIRSLTIWLIICLTPALVLAEDGPYLQINLASHHVDSEIDFNEENFGLGLLWKTDYGMVSTGYFKNSLDNDSVYLLYGLGTKGKWIRFNIFAGAASGYESEQFGNVVPVLIPMISIGNLSRFNVGVLPKTPESPVTYTFQVALAL